MNLNVSVWKEFRFGNLITDIYKAKAINKNDLTKSVIGTKAIRYITRTNKNNGCEMLADITYVNPNYIELGNAITIGDTTATCFYQVDQFITGDHMVIIRSEWLNEILGLFIVTILQNEQYKYSYGRAFLIDKICDTIIKLPIQYNSDGTPFIDNTNKYNEEGYIPDFKFMENYIKSLNYKQLTTSNKTKKVPALNVENWRDFNIVDLFQIKRGNITSLNEIDEGSVPIVSASGDNEGISFYGDVPALYKNKITISMNGVNTGFTAYHGYDFNINVDCCVLLEKFDMNVYIGEFIATIIGKLQYKYSYGRKISVERINTESIKLPVQHNSDGTIFIDYNKTYSPKGYVPDWRFMENYIKALPYGDRL